jgi:hypothetical protein
MNFDNNYSAEHSSLPIQCTMNRLWKLSTASKSFHMCRHFCMHEYEMVKDFETRRKDTTRGHQRYKLRSLCAMSTEEGV